MALAAKQDYCVERNKAPAEIVPMPKRGQANVVEDVQQRVVRHGVQEYAQRATDLVRETKDAAQKAYEQARSTTIDSYSRVVNRAQDLRRRTQARVRQTKEENPLQLLGVIAGAAFVVGMAIRFWRSRRS